MTFYAPQLKLDDEILIRFLSILSNLFTCDCPGSLAPKRRIQQTPPKLNAAQLEVLQRLVEEHNDATLAELQTLLEQETGVCISRTTVDRMLKKLNITVKKNISRR